VLIYAIEANPDYLDALTWLFGEIDQRRVVGVTSELTLMEVLVKPLQNNNDALAQQYEDILSTEGSFYMAEVTKEILKDAANIRAAHNLKTPDAIHAATALHYGCQDFVTNDNKRFTRVSGLNILLLGDIQQAVLSANQDS
jgi:predicted nucleic acid-binding protein